MPSTAIAFGTILILIGVIGYINGMMSNAASITALIPAFIGLILLLLGLFSRMKEHLRKHLMHAAVVIALLGFIAVAADVVRKIDTLSYTAANVSKISTALVCLLFVILGIRSFAEARRKNAEI